MEVRDGSFMTATENADIKSAVDRSRRREVPDSITNEMPYRVRLAGVPRGIAGIVSRDLVLDLSSAG